MIIVTENASEKLLAYLQSNNISSSLRITILPGGCQGTALGLALDEKKGTDESFEQRGLNLLVDQNLLQQCGTITVDYIYAGAKSGFRVKSEHPLPGAGGGCSSGTCGSGGCGC